MFIYAYMQHKLYKDKKDKYKVFGLAQISIFQITCQYHLLAQGFKRFKKKKPFSMEISSLVMYLSWDRVQVFPCQKPAAAACISYVILILCSHFFFQLWLLRGEKKEFIGKREQREKGGLQSRLHHNLSKKRAELIVYSLIIFFRYISYLLDSLVYSQLQKKCLPSLQHSWFS